MATAYKNPFDDAPSKPTQTKPKSKSKKTEAKPKELNEKQKHYKAQTEQLLNLPKEQMDKLINAYQKAVSDMEKAKENYSKLRRTLLRINREGGNALGNDLNVKFVEYESVTFPRSVVEKALGKDEAYKIAKTLLEVFKAIDKGTISLDFTIRTKMNLPSFSYRSVYEAFEKKLAKGIRYGKINPQDVVLLPVNLLNDTVEGATNMTTALIDGIVQLGSFMLGPFRKEEYN